MQTYLITGGCGFIGSHLASRLLADAHHVRILDNLSNATIDSAPRGADVIVGDILDEAKLGLAMRGVGGCFHLAAVASVQACRDDPIKTRKVNVIGTSMVLDHARRAGGVPVVYTSSAAVYGDAAGLSLSEAAQPHPLTAYGADKLGCEEKAAWISRQYGLPTLGFRLFNVYGPGQDPCSPYSGAISTFCDRARRRLPLVVYGDGLQTRDFVHVRDVAEQLARSLQRKDLSPSVFNLCTGTPVTIVQLARLVIAVSGAESKVYHASPRPGEVRHSVGDFSRAREALGFEPKIPLETGLREILAAH